MRSDDSARGREVPTRVAELLDEIKSGAHVELEVRTCSVSGPSVLAQRGGHCTPNDVGLVCARLGVFAHQPSCCMHRPCSAFQTCQAKQAGAFASCCQQVRIAFFV